MRFGLALPQYGYSIADGPVGWKAVSDVARSAEDLGFSSVWLSDHLFLDTAKYGGPNTRYGAMECFASAAALGATTSTIQIGTLVVCNDLRHPAIVAKMASTADLICGGRFTLGLGAGWYEPEFQAAGINFYPAGTRVSRLKEAVQIVVGMLSEDSFTFSGDHYTVTDAINLPRRNGERLKVLVGGKGDRVVKIAGRYADGFNSVWAWRPEAFADRLDVLSRAEKASGRDRRVTRSVGLYVLMGSGGDDIEEAWKRYSAASPPGTAPQMSAKEWGEDKLFGTPEQIASTLSRFEGIGVEEVILGFGLLPFQLVDMGMVERFSREFIS